MSLYAHKLQIFPNNEIRSSIVRLYQKARPLPDDEPVDLDPLPSNLTLAQYSKELESGPAIAFQKCDSPAGYGSLGRETPFTTLARRTILRAGGALQKEHRANECLFLTATLPGSTLASFEALAKWSGFAVQRLKAWIGFRQKENLSLYCWEYQKRGALHLHYVVCIRDPELQRWIIEGFQAQWIRILDAIARNSGVDVYSKGGGFTHSGDKSVVQTRAEVCKFSVAGYLAKYLSKSSHSNESRSKWRFPPSRWYGVSRPLHVLIRKYTCTTERVFARLREALVAYEDSLSPLQSYSIKHYTYRHGCTAFRTCIGYFSEQEIKTVWSHMTNSQLPHKDSATTGAGKGTQLIQQGLNGLQSLEFWANDFNDIASPYVKNLITDWKASQPMSTLDKIYLLDTLAYALNYARKTGRVIPARWLQWKSECDELLEKRFSRTPAPFVYQSTHHKAPGTVDKNLDLREPSTRPEVIQGQLL